MTHPKLICLLAFLPIIFSLPTPPIPGDPAIRFQITKKGFEKLDEVFLTHDCTHDILGLIFELDYNGETLNGSVSRAEISESKTEVIENTKEPFSHEGFTRVDISENTLHRKKRHAATHTKIYYEDSEFVADQEIGGVKVVQKGLTYEVDLSKRDDHLHFELTNGVKKAQLYLGQQDGRLKIGRLAVEIDGDLKATKNGEVLDLTEEKRNEFLQTFVETLLKRTLLFVKKRYEDYKYIIGSNVFDKIVFDYRLTEHPQFKDGVAEFALVGKFIYDEEEKYTDKNVYEELDEMLQTIKVFQHSDDLKTGDDTFTKVVCLHDTEEAPNTEALATEGSDEEEAARKALGAIRVNLSDELFNSFFDALIKSGVTKMKFSNLLIKFILDLYNDAHDKEPVFDTTKVPDDLELAFDLQHYGDEDKFYTFYEDGFIEKGVLIVKYKNLVAKYKSYFNAKILLRNDKLAIDLLKQHLEKEADNGFPDILSEEVVKKLMTECAELFKHHVFVEDASQKIFTELSLKDGHFIFGLKSIKF